MAEEIMFLQNNEKEISGKLSENDVLSIVKSDFKEAQKETNHFIERIEQWRKEYNGMPYGNETKHKSSIVSKDIKKYSSWLQSALIDPFISTPDIVRCYPANPRSSKAAKCAEIVLNTQFCRQFNRFNFMSKAISVLEVEGTLVIKTGWESAKDKREVVYNIDTPLSVIGKPLQPEIPQEVLQQVAQENPEQAQLLQLASQPALDELGRQVYHHEEQTREEDVYVINRPTAIVCRNEDIFLDPTCLGNFDDANFIIHRYQTDLSTLKADGRYKNLDKIKIRKKQKDLSIHDNYVELTDFEFSDEARSKILVYEYWGYVDVDGDGIAEPIVLAHVDDTVIRFEDNPYPDKKLPFIVVPYLPKPFQLYGEAQTELLRDNQKLKTAIFRGIVDNMSNSNNGQIAIRKGMLDEVNKDRMLAGLNFETNGDPNGAMVVGNYNQLPASVFNVLQLLDAESTQLTGVNVYGQSQTTDRIGNDNGSKGVLDGGNVRKLQVVKNIAENLVKPLLRKWLEYSAWLLDYEQVFRITGGDHFEIIKRDDLYGEIDVDLTISTNEDNAVRTNQLAFLLQTIGPNEDPNIRKMIMAEIMRLHKMPELATRIETYEPQPDPLLVAQQQLMIEKLKAEIAELQANAGKIEQDGILKSAKAQSEGARAEQTKAQTDRINLDFIQQQRGQKDQLDMMKLQAQLESNEKIAKMSQDAMLANNIYKDMISRQERENQKAQKEDEDKSKRIQQEIDKYQQEQEDKKETIKQLKSSYSPSINEPRNKIKYRSK